MPPFIRNFLRPVLQNLIASALGAGAMFIGSATLSNIPGCPEAVRADLVRGEEALLGAHADEAYTIASDVLALAPRCSAATALRARASLSLKRQAEIDGLADAVKLHRSECYRDAASIYRSGDPPPVVEAVRNNCKARATPSP